MVDLPEPVGPVTRTRPRGRLANWATGVGQAEGVEGHDLVGDDPHDGADGVALEEDVDPEAAHAGDGVRGVELELVLEPLPLLLGEDGVEQLRGSPSR